jgi:putative membrane protein
MRSLKDYLVIGLKGACMGGADVIPGVSGGTIAFIMGIYDEFVGSIAKLDGTAVQLLLKGKLREFWKFINGSFLLAVLAGIGVSVVSLAGLMQMLLRDFPIQTWAFFFGLIVASSIFILRGISGWKVKDALFLVAGCILGVVVCTLSPTQTPDALWFIFLSGAIAICAMILPGISGSFILLILGKYEYIMSCITGVVSGQDVLSNILILAVFLIGAAVGIVSFSKFLHWLLARWHKETLIVLAGFIIGSLVKVWPWSNTAAVVSSQFPEVAALGEAAEHGTLAAQETFEAAVAANAPMIDMQIGLAVVFALIGFFLVTGVEIAGKLLAKKNKA